MGSNKVEVTEMTIEEAKEIYKKYHCSCFAMAREDLITYNKYQELCIDKELERQWRIEEIENLVSKLKETGDSRIFNRLYDLSESFHDAERLEMMIGSIDIVKINNAKTSLCIAETIIGRKTLSVRSGMIFWAYDIGRKKEAVALTKKALSLTNIITDDIEIKRRADRDREKLKKIVGILDFGTETIFN